MGAAGTAGGVGERGCRVMHSAALCLSSCTMAGAQPLDIFSESINAVKAQGHHMDASSEHRCQQSFPAAFRDSTLCDPVVNKYLMHTKTFEIVFEILINSFFFFKKSTIFQKKLLGSKSIRVLCEDFPTLSHLNVRLQCNA